MPGSIFELTGIAKQATQNTGKPYCNTEPNVRKKNIKYAIITVNMNS